MRTFASVVKHALAVGAALAVASCVAVIALRRAAASVCHSEGEPSWLATSCGAVTAEFPARTRSSRPMNIHPATPPATTPRNAHAAINKVERVTRETGRGVTSSGGVNDGVWTASLTGVDGAAGLTPADN
jgi:hypothetical protein